jgi:hypothetical protein
MAGYCIPDDTVPPELERLVPLLQGVVPQLRLPRCATKAAATAVDCIAVAAVPREYAWAVAQLRLPPCPATAATTPPAGTAGTPPTTPAAGAPGTPPTGLGVGVVPPSLGWIARPSGPAAASPPKPTGFGVGVVPPPPRRNFGPGQLRHRFDSAAIRRSPQTHSFQTRRWTPPQQRIAVSPRPQFRPNFTPRRR